MKTLLPILAVVLIAIMCAGSSILYLNNNYGTSALLTVLWFLGVTLLIGRKVKQNETEKRA
jgi:hypothetical protein